MAVSNEKFTEIIGKVTSKVTGIKASEFSMCATSNSTYVDCPIKDSFEQDFIVTSYNPSTVDELIQRIKVPPANYSV